MTLIDTSIVIDYVRGKDAKLASLLPTVSPAICGVTRAELLCGARDAKHRASLQTLLSAFDHVPIEEWFWDSIGDNLSLLRASGITVPFQDVVITTVAIENDVELWTRDKQFSLIQTAVPALKLFQEPP